VGLTRILLGLLLYFMVPPLISHADQLDPAIVKALGEAQKMLTDPNSRAAISSKDPAAAASVENLESVAGTKQNADQMFQFAAEILSQLVTQTGGDPNKLTALIEKLKTNPQALESMLTASQKAKLKALASQIRQPAQKPVP
jgi:organic radical activating enzyme